MDVGGTQRNIAHANASNGAAGMPADVAAAPGGDPLPTVTVRVPTTVDGRDDFSRVVGTPVSGRTPLFHEAITQQNSQRQEVFEPRPK